MSKALRCWSDCKEEEEEEEKEEKEEEEEERERKCVCVRACVHAHVYGVVWSVCLCVCLCVCVCVGGISLYQYVHVLKEMSTERATILLARVQCQGSVPEGDGNVTGHSHVYMLVKLKIITCKPLHVNLLVLHI